MSRPNRIRRPKNELKKELLEQLQLLRHACQSFDSGLEAIGKHIALSLRVLLHQSGKSRSLLDQLELRSGRFLDSAGPLTPGNLLTECNLVAHSISNSGGSYIPLITAGFHLPVRPISFVSWWNDPILKDNLGRTFCRRELVLHVADTDGGAHVDPELDEAYMALSRSNALNWVFVSGSSIDSLMKVESQSVFEGRPELACMRQIAHELLCTINQFVPEFREHAAPIIPADSLKTNVSLDIGHRY